MLLTYQYILCQDGVDIKYRDVYDDAIIRRVWLILYNTYMS